MKVKKEKIDRNSFKFSDKTYSNRVSLCNKSGSFEFQYFKNSIKISPKINENLNKNNKSSHRRIKSEIMTQNILEEHTKSILNRSLEEICEVSPNSSTTKEQRKSFGVKKRLSNIQINNLNINLKKDSVSTFSKACVIF